MKRTLITLAAAAIAVTATACGGEDLTEPTDPTSAAVETSVAVPVETQTDAPVETTEPAPATTAAEPATETAAPTETEAPAEAGPTLSDDELAEVFTSIQFIPDQYDTPADMFASVYPGVTTTSPCLNVLGVGDLALDGATTEFGTSNDRTLTAVITSASSKEAADGHMATLSDLADQCIADPQITFNGAPLPVEFVREDDPVSGADDSFTIQMSGDVSGAPVAVLGSVAQYGQDIVLVAGWDPASQAANVPMATDFFARQIEGTRS